LNIKTIFAAGIELDSLNPELFLFEKYSPDWWHDLDLEYVACLDFPNVLRKVKEYAIGYCDGGRLQIRPRSDSYAIMFEKDGDTFWFHIDKWCFDDKD